MSECGSSDGEVDFKPSIDISSLPTPVQNRVKALKNLQLKTVQVVLFLIIVRATGYYKSILGRIYAPTHTIKG